MTKIARRRLLRVPTKKTVIQVAGNPQYAKKPSPSQVILNPATGLPSFGTFPAINVQGAVFAGGPIYLRYGKHIGTGRGWGFEHIWQARFPQCADQAAATPHVVGLVSSILIPGAAIHHEFIGMGTAAQRTSVFRSNAGVLIVEERFDGSNAVFYSIVTGIQTQKVFGQRIGTI